MSAAKLPANNVLVMFGSDVPDHIKGPFLLEMETYLRCYHKLDVEVFMETMRDQNKLRRDLTREDII